MKKNITKKSTLAEILRVKSAEKILEKYRVPCLSCPMASFELEKLQIGQVCKMYGLPEEKIIKELNLLLVK